VKRSTTRSTARGTNARADVGAGATAHTKEIEMRFQALRWVAAASAVVALAACGGGSSGGTTTSASGSASASSGAIKTGLKIAVLPKAINIPYFDAAYAGAQKACAEIKAECKQVGPTQATGQAQVPYINTVIQQQYDALVISAADANSVVPALKKAQAAGVTVVTYDADVADTSARSAMVKPTTPDQIGQSQVDWIAKAIGSGGGEVAILSAAATAENQNTWIKFMKEQFKKYPELKLVDTVYGNDDAATSAEKAAALLQSHPNLKGIISPTTVGIAAAAKYISGSQYKGKVQVTGLGLPSEMKAYVKDGTVKSFGLWDPGMLGYVGVYAAAIKASGGDLSGGIKAGDKTYTLDQDGVAIIGPPLEFTADNIDQFNF
jgi:rhamnose transport system substrate-binding protein